MKVRFLYSTNSQSIINAPTLAEAIALAPPNPILIEPNYSSPNHILDLQLEELHFRFEYTIEEASGDGWNEPHEPRHTYVTRAFYNNRWDGKGLWIEIIDPERAFQPGTWDFIQSECDDRA